jgi:hypothetical protein
MSNFFGDWFGDMLVVGLILVVFIIYCVFLSKEEDKRNQAGMVASGLVSIILGFQFFGLVVFNDYFNGPQHGIGFSLIIFLGALVSFFVLVKRVFSEEEQ